MVAVQERFYTERLDPTLAARLPPDLQLIRTAAFPTRLSRRFGIGDIGLRAYPFLKSAIQREITSRRPEAILITGSPYYPMLLSGWIQRLFGVPVVLDFQDPWVSAWGATRRPLTKAWASHRLACRLEPLAVRSASFVTSVSDVQNRQFSHRYPWFDPSRLAAIPIGGDPDDFTLHQRRLGGGVAPPSDMTTLHFSYVGSYWPRAEGPIRQLFAGVAQFRRESPELAQRVRLNFIGTDSRNSQVASDQVRPFAEAMGVDDLLEEAPRRLPHLEALQKMADADVLLLVGSDEPHYTASKIYPALLSGRPYLSLFHRESSAHAILSEAGGGASIAFSNPDELKATTPAIVKALRALVLSPEAVGAANTEVIAPYTARAVAGRFAEILDRVARK